jgi:hypothetical protein
MSRETGPLNGPPDIERLEYLVLAYLSLSLFTLLRVDFSCRSRWTFIPWSVRMALKDREAQQNENSGQSTAHRQEATDVPVLLAALVGVALTKRMCN